MKLLTRYIAWRVFMGIMLAFLIVTSIILLVDFVEATRNIGDDGVFSLAEIGGLTLLKIPQLIEETIPFVVLFGVMGALYSLNKRSELVVLRASGLSAWRFLRPAVFVSGLIGLIWALVFNPLAAKSMARYQTILGTAALNIQKNSTPESKLALSRAFQPIDIWLREGSQNGQVVIHGTLLEPSSPMLHDVTFYYYETARQTLPSQTALEGTEITADITGETQFSRRIDARSAVLSPAGYWTLRGVISNTHEGRIDRDFSRSLPTKLGLQDLHDQSRSQLKTAFWNLPSEISQAEAAGFSTVGLRLQWHKLLALPLTLIALTVIAAAVSMGNIRSGGALRMMMMGGIIGFGIYFSNTLINAFGQAQTLPVIVATWSVPVLAFCLGLSFLSRLEDG